MKTIIKTVCCILILNLSALAANYTVKSDGSGDYTTIQACASAMSSGDTCTVYAGTYDENVTVPAGAAGNYKTITVNGSDIVSVLGFTLNSHTKLIGNCPTKQGTVTTATCGFFISNPSSPGSAACVALGANTDVYVTNNVMSQCGSGLASSGSCGSGMIHSSTGSSYIYIQGNTLSYASGPIGGPVGMGMDLAESGGGDHFLVEDNDLSHYDLGIKFNTLYGVYRNNSFHDQLETEGCENQHTDEFFSEPGVSIAVQHNLMEGNYQRNAVGANAKTLLAQSDNNGATCPNCSYLISRYNTVSRIGSGAGSNYYWPHLVSYNNTIVDALSDTGASGSDADNSESTLNGAYLNQLYWFSFSGSNFNVYGCGPNCNYGHSLYWCTGTCTSVHDHTYGAGSWLNDPGNETANPMFVNYISAGNPSNDYHLQASSPAIAAGTYLTTVASGDTGSGTSLVVTDASYFQDGYSLSNANSTVHGDCIAVNTASNHVCVTAVNYTTNTLTLASSITRSSGQGIYLYSKSDGVQVLTGATPDMGAFPYGGGGSPPMPPTSLKAIVN
jgi:hypothetical protein